MPSSGWAIEGTRSLRSSGWLSPSGFVIASLAAGAGLAVVALPSFALACAALAIILGFGIQRPNAVARAGSLALLGGAMLLGYGFANLGVRAGPVPIPLTEMILLPLVATALWDRQYRLDPRVLLPLSLYGLLVGIRLVFDYPVWGIFAIRDTTLAIEMFVLAVGYRAVARDGVQAWINRMKLIFPLVLLYGALYPWRQQISDFGPTVGLQRPVPLLDPQGVKHSVIAVALFFSVFTKGWMRVGLLGIVAGLLGIFQARTLYVLFPVTLLILGWAAHRLTSTVIRLAPVLFLGAAVIAYAGSQGIEGRRGEVSSAFISDHALTLAGQEGPFDGTIQARIRWFRQTVDEVTKSPLTVAAGVGLGPDLTFGFRGKEDQAVRKPHDDYLEVWARTGTLGLMLFLWVIISSLIPILRKARSGTGTRENFCAWVFAAALVYLGVAAAQPLLSFPYGSIPLFFLLGSGLAASRADDSGRHKMVALTSLGLIPPKQKHSLS